MAVPKKRTSSTKRGMRRSHHAITHPSLSKCPKCGAPTPMHQVCRGCGTYRGREVVKT